MEVGKDSIRLEYMQEGKGRGKDQANSRHKGRDKGVEERVEAKVTSSLWNKCVKETDSGCRWGLTVWINSID